MADEKDKLKKPHRRKPGPLLKQELVTFAVYDKDTGEVFSGGQCQAIHLEVQATPWPNALVVAYEPETPPPHNRSEKIDTVTKRVKNKKGGGFAHDNEHIPF